MNSPFCHKLLGLLAWAFLVGCASGPKVDRARRGETNGQAFELQSGSPLRKDGRGQWSLRLRGDAMWVAFTKDGKVKEYGSFKLRDAEADRAWKLVWAARFDEIESSSEENDEVTFFFAWLRPGEPVVTVDLARAQAVEDPQLRDLLKYFMQLLRKYTEATVAF